MSEEPIMEDPFSNEPIHLEESKKNWKIWLAGGGCILILCAAAFTGGIIAFGPETVQQYIPNPVQSADEIPRTLTQSNTMGDPNAPVYIVEFGDFQCPYCLRFWSQTEPQLIEEYVNTGKVYFEYRSVGEFLGPESAWAAEGAYCAGDQEKFWEFHDTLYTNWTGENVGDYTKDKLVQYAKTLDLDTDEFKSCIDDGRHAATVEQDAADAEAAGAYSTPTFFINGVKVEGAQPFEIMKKYIEDALNGNLNILNG